MTTSDEQAIANLLFAYAEAVDDGDFQRVGSLFAHATFRAVVPGGVHVVTGAEGVAAQFAATTRRHEDGTPRTRHLTTNLAVVVGPDGTDATCRAYFCVQQVVDGRLQPIIAGRYHDAFEKVEGTWRFRDRLIMTDLIGDLREHLLITLPGA